MRRRLHRSSYGRVVFAAAALYALLLQGFLAAATPTGLPSVAGLLCAELAGGSHRPVDNDPSGHGEGCCTAACFASATSAPPASGAVAFTPPAFVPLGWAKRAERVEIGPPGGSARARGPPLV
jgi:hypothetical protein